MTPAISNDIQCHWRAVSYQDVLGTQLQYDKVSLAFTSLSQSSWYRLTRPKAIYRQIKTYFVSCLLDKQETAWIGWYCALVRLVCSFSGPFHRDLLPEAFSSTCSLDFLFVEYEQHTKGWYWETALDSKAERKAKSRKMVCGIANWGDAIPLAPSGESLTFWLHDLDVCRLAASIVGGNWRLVRQTFVWSQQIKQQQVQTEKPRN